VARSLRELTSGYGESPEVILGTTFEQEYDEMVVVRSIEFWSLCEHHVLPFHGHCTVGYIPQKRVVGLSKVARLVDMYARRLQIQERMTRQIADAMQKYLAPLGVGVIIEATHTCMAMRGIRSTAPMITSALLGRLTESGPARAEFLALRGQNGHH
jgi:GTP cyclohydrolase I